MKSGREPQRKLEMERREEGRKEGRKEEKNGVVIEQPSSRQRQTKKGERRRVRKWKRVFNDEEKKGGKLRKPRNEKEGQMPTARTDCSR